MPIHPRHKIAAAIADVAMGLSLREAGRKHGVSHSCVARWAKKMPMDSLDPSLEQLFEDVLRARLKVCESVYEFLQDPDRGPEYFRDQPVGDMLAGIGVREDKNLIAALFREHNKRIASTVDASISGSEEESDDRPALPPVGGVGENGHGPPVG